MSPYPLNRLNYSTLRQTQSPPKLPLGKLSVAVGAWLLAILFVITAHSQARTEASPSLSSYTQQQKVLSSYTEISSNSRLPNVHAKAYLLLDATSSEILLSKNEKVSLPVASTTKMTTALTALSLYKPDNVITVPKAATLINGSKIGLRTGEKLTVADLLKGLLISSGNDAAYTLALADDPKQESTAPFVQKMNALLKSDHISSSSYADPAGLDDENGRSTAFDLAHIARLLLAQEALASIVKTANTTIASQDGLTTHQLKSSNRLLLGDSQYYMPDVIGVKTGFTLEAGHSLVAAYKWHDRVLIGVVLNTTESTIEASAKEMSKLFRWAETNLTTQTYN